MVAPSPWWIFVKSSSALLQASRASTSVFSTFFVMTTHAPRVGMMRCDESLSGPVATRRRRTGGRTAFRGPVVWQRDVFHRRAAAARLRIQTHQLADFVGQVGRNR